MKIKLIYKQVLNIFIGLYLLYVMLYPYCDQSVVYEGSFRDKCRIFVSFVAGCLIILNLIEILQKKKIENI